MNTSNVDDSSPVLLLHIRDGVFDCVEIGTQIQSNNLLKHLLRPRNNQNNINISLENHVDWSVHVLNRLNMLHASIVDEDIDATEDRGYLLNHFLNFFRSSQIIVSIDRSHVVGGLNGFSDLLDFSSITESVEDNICTSSSQGVSASKSDSTGATSNKCSLSWEIDVWHLFYIIDFFLLKMKIWVKDKFLLVFDF